MKYQTRRESALFVCFRYADGLAFDASKFGSMYEKYSLEALDILYTFETLTLSRLKDFWEWIKIASCRLHHLSVAMPFSCFLNPKFKWYRRLAIAFSIYYENICTIDCPRFGTYKPHTILLFFSTLIECLVPCICQGFLFL